LNVTDLFFPFLPQKAPSQLARASCLDRSEVARSASDRSNETDSVGADVFEAIVRELVNKVASLAAEEDEEGAVGPQASLWAKTGCTTVATEEVEGGAVARGR
jgi:hypothetical protein